MNNSHHLASKKIVHLARWYAPHIGGVETHVSALNEYFIAQGHQVTVVCEQHDADLPLRESQGGATIIRLPLHASGKKLSTWLWLWQQRHELFSADVIQVHDVFWWLWPFWPLLRHKVFTTFHGWETHYPVRWQAKLQRWWAALVSQKTTHVGDWIREFYWDTPDAVTYGGVTAVKEQATPRVRKKDEPFHITFLGRLSSENEIEKYIELIKQLQDMNALQVTWVGEGPLRSRCEKFGTVTGWVKNPDKYVQQADLVFATSYLSILSAQAQAKIVCAFYSHDLKKRYLETFPGSKHMLITSDISLMTEKIKKILSNQAEVRSFQRAAKTFALAQSWDNVAALYEKLWGWRPAS